MTVLQLSRYRLGLLVNALFILVVLPGCHEPGESGGFTLLPPERTGIRFANNLAETDSFSIIQYLYFYNGAGVGVGDFDNDGWEDLVFASNQGSPALYLNNGEGDLTFSDVSEATGLVSIDGWGTGVSVADIDGDGWLDIYLCQLGAYKGQTGKNRMLINQYGLTDSLYFTDKAAEWGVDFSGFSTQAAFFDFDLDGDLDMYLLNHSVHDPGNYGQGSLREIPDAKAGDRLYRHDKGVFTDITGTSGILSSKIGYGLGVSISDLNMDGWPDIYVGNDFHENDYLYLNMKDGTFREVIGESMGHTSQFSMGVDIADLNDDQKPDVVTLDMMPPDEFTRKTSVGGDRFEIAEFKNSYGYHHQLPRNHLQINLGNVGRSPRFSDIAQWAGIESTDWSWSVLLADYDNDGKKDLFVSNGILRRPNDLDYLNYISNPIVQRDATDLEIASQMPSGKVSNMIFSQEEALRFQNRTVDWNLVKPSISTGAAYADFDLDGDLDIITSEINAPAIVYRNDINHSANKNFIRFELVGTRNNPGAIGTTIMVFLEDQSKTITHQPVRGFMSCSSHRLHLGLGKWDEIDSVVVIWPEGNRAVMHEVSINNTVKINQADYPGDVPVAQRKEYILFEKTNLVEHVHREDPYIDLEKEKLIPGLLSREGPALVVGDINGDHIDDLFIGGAAGEKASLWVQNKQGNLIETQRTFWEGERAYEDTDAVLKDLDGDGDLDLFVASGGNHLEEGSPLYANRLYENDGNGRFTRKRGALPLIIRCTSVVKAVDLDDDGDEDLFVGDRIGDYYGDRTEGYILVNDGSGSFRNVIPLPGLGMVTDAEWADINRDGRTDLVVVGEWMPVTVFYNRANGFVRSDVKGTEGLWSSICVTDLNDDGWTDVIAGNFGLNHNLTRDREQLRLYIKDFDDNESMDPVLSYWNDGEFPVLSKDELVSQMPFIKKSFNSYNAFATVSTQGVFGQDALKESEQYDLYELESIWLKNIKGETFEIREMPEEVQYAPVNAIKELSFRQSHIKWFVLAGNKLDLIPRIGMQAANTGMLASFDGKKWIIHASEKTGLYLKGNINHLGAIKIVDRGNHLLAASSSGSLQIYKYDESMIKSLQQ